MLPPSGSKLLLQPASVEQRRNLRSGSPALLKQNLLEETHGAWAGANILIGGVTPRFMVCYVDIPPAKTHLREWG